MVKTLCFQCRGHGFDPWLGNLDPTCSAVCSQTEKKKKSIKVFMKSKENIWGEKREIPFKGEEANHISRNHLGIPTCTPVS